MPRCPQCNEPAEVILGDVCTCPRMHRWASCRVHYRVVIDPIAVDDGGCCCRDRVGEEAKGG